MSRQYAQTLYLSNAKGWAMGDGRWAMGAVTPHLEGSGPDREALNPECPRHRLQPLSQLTRPATWGSGF